MKQLKTRWTEQVDPEHVWEEYPRPMMKRESYVNLNGLWKYAITRGGKAPREYDGKILVPFSPESLMSGVRRQLKPAETLWYERTLPEQITRQEGMRWILHFGAVDQYAEVRVNGKLAVRHLGGYLPFSADITGLLRDGRNELCVKVRDYSDTFYYSKGKQRLRRGGMYYTAQSGIWQTVWMEQVPEKHMTQIVCTPDYDRASFRILVRANVPEEVTVSVVEETGLRPQVTGRAGKEILVPVGEVHPWSPEDPYLYHLEVRMGEDRAESYGAMRKVEVRRDKRGIPRIWLNDRPYYQKGVLDQGYWPDGLYTAPCDEAMIYDIRTMKELGFNLLRKHIKIEPQRWYYHCDRLGMLVWQDMVNGGRNCRAWYVTYLATAMEYLGIRLKDRPLAMLGRREEKGRRQFVREMKQTIRTLYNHPSIVTWVIFNEGWGQFHTRTMGKITAQMDSTRLIDEASGWFDQGEGHIRSIHDYFFPLKVQPEKRVTALTEFGGFSFSIPGHRMYRKVYGYRIYHDSVSLTRGYREWHEKELLPAVDHGISASIYTQLSDVEEEVNGIISYDREIVKLEKETVQEMNERLTLDEAGDRIEKGKSIGLSSNK